MPIIKLVLLPCLTLQKVDLKKMSKGKQFPVNEFSVDITLVDASEDSSLENNSHLGIKTVEFTN